MTDRFSGTGSSQESDEGIIIDARYEILKKIGYGSFGDIFKGLDMESNKEVALKMEASDRQNPQLIQEYRVYKNLEGCEGIPKVFWLGKEGGFNIMVMELLGPNLEVLFKKCNRKFSLKTVLLIADQLLRRLESIHRRNFVHRDIKPENILVGMPPEGLRKIYFIDYGLAKQYRHPITKEHILYRDGKNLTGTASFASINSHLGVELSRRDDIEELALLLVYFSKGTLPWKGLRAKNKSEKYKKIETEKMRHSVKKLCSGLPEEFSTLLYYARALRFDEPPDYQYLRRMFNDLFRKHRFLPDDRYDWVLLEEENQKARERLHSKSNRDIHADR